MRRAIFIFAVGLFEGVGLLALVPLLQLVGMDAERGSLGPVTTAFRDAFGVAGLQLTLPLVLGLYVVVVGLQVMCLRQQTVLQELAAETAQAIAELNRITETSIKKLNEQLSSQPHIATGAPLK